MVNRPPRLKSMGVTQTSRNKEAEEEKRFEASLSQEQLQVLEEENNSMLEGFERTLDQIKYHPSLSLSPIPLPPVSYPLTII